MRSICWKSPLVMKSTTDQSPHSSEHFLLVPRHTSWLNTVDGRIAFCWFNWLYKLGWNSFHLSPLTSPFQTYYWISSMGERHQNKSLNYKSETNAGFMFCSPLLQKNNTSKESDTVPCGLLELPQVRWWRDRGAVSELSETRFRRTVRSSQIYHLYRRGVGC